MSNAADRRGSPRRHIELASIFVRVVTTLYSTLPLIVFIGNGSWFAGCLALFMLRWAFRPLKLKVINIGGAS